MSKSAPPDHLGTIMALRETQFMSLGSELERQAGGFDGTFPPALQYPEFEGSIRGY